ncbi:MAG TPA: hypothetical protein VN688_19495 [Gemmataceae bacterium]|nr:hypothetical protein [Gemmataceae bacterium]
MTRRFLCACLGVAVFTGALEMPARAVAKPPDLPMNETITAAPQADPMPSEANTGSLIFGVGVNSNSGLTGSIAVNERNFDVVQAPAEEELPPAKSIYDTLPAAVPTPALYELHPTARRTLAGSMLFGVNPLLALLPTDKALDAPNDHPQKVAGDDVFGDMPPCQGRLVGGPIACAYMAFEALPMPQEDKPAKKKHKKHHRKGERLSMPQEDAPATTSADGVTCPFLRQQYVDRHACQFADPQIGHDVLDNLARLKKAEALLELAEKLAQTGNIGEALECCVHAQNLCPGSPCASRAADVMLDVCFGADKPAMATEEAAEAQPEARRLKCPSKQSAIEKKLQQPVNVNFTNAPLRQVIDDLRELFGINIYVDEPALAEKGISLDSPITIKLDNLSFKSTLNLLLHSVHLTYIVKEEVVQITTEEHACGKLVQCVYQVADLVEQKDLPNRCKAKPVNPHESGKDCLIRLLTTTIDPRSWSEQGGPGTIDFFPLSKSLVVNQTADVQDQITDLLAALRRLYEQEGEKRETKAEPGTEQQVDGLMKACRLLMNEGLHEQAAELARQAFALDPERVMADPLLYKMHLLADAPAKQSAGSSEASEPPSCPYCPHGGKPISEIVPEKKTTESGPSTLLVPPLPPIDYEVVPALDRVLTEQTESAAGSEEASEDDMPSSLQELVESIMGPSQTLLGVGVNADGGLRVISAYPLGGSVYHVQYSRGCLAIWKTPDAAKLKP